jgi:hypothetical protein
MRYGTWITTRGIQAPHLVAGVYVWAVDDAAMISVAHVCLPCTEGLQRLSTTTLAHCCMTLSLRGSRALYAFNEVRCLLRVRVNVSISGSGGRCDYMLAHVC